MAAVAAAAVGKVEEAHGRVKKYGWAVETVVENSWFVWRLNK